MTSLALWLTVCAVALAHSSTCRPPASRVRPSHEVCSARLAATVIKQNTKLTQSINGKTSLVHRRNYGKHNVEIMDVLISTNALAWLSLTDDKTGRTERTGDTDAERDAKLRAKSRLFVHIYRWLRGWFMFLARSVPVWVCVRILSSVCRDEKLSMKEKGDFSQDQTRTLFVYNRWSKHPDSLSPTQFIPQRQRWARRNSFEFPICLNNFSIPEGRRIFTFNSSSSRTQEKKHAATRA